MLSRSEVTCVPVDAFPATNSWAKIVLSFMRSQRGLALFTLVSLEALWSVLMHFGQPLRTLVILDDLGSAWMHFGQALSTLVILDDL